MMKSASPTLIALAFFVASCGEQQEPPRVQPHRPVRVFSLVETAPPSDALFPGLVTPYREAELAFEVAGRVTRLANVGDDMLGDRVDGDGVSIAAGTVVAEIDSAPYERALKQAQRRLEAAQSRLVALQVQLERVLPARLETARFRAASAWWSVSYAEKDLTSLESTVTLARTTLERNRDLLPTGAVSDIAVRESATALNIAEARLAQGRAQVATRKQEESAATSAIDEAEGAVALQEATIASQEALIDELEQVVLDATSDLEDCVLRAPFDGRITDVQVAEGSYVGAGSPVVTLTMLNPVEVELTVAPSIEDDLLLGSGATVFPISDGRVETDRAVDATVFEKRGVANVGTRTFTVGLIAANRRRTPQSQRADRPSTPYLLPVLENPLDLPGASGLYVVDQAIGRSDDGPYALKVRGVRRSTRSTAALSGVLRAEVVPVELGESRVKVASFELVELLDTGAIGIDDMLVAFPTKEHAEAFVVSDNRWLLRPGDLVQVAIGREARTTGLWVPVQAIQEINGETALFVVDESSRVIRVPVSVADSAGELRLVDGPADLGGARVVLDGAHFLMDGDAVTVTSTIGEVGP